jgi:hypothetical protein
MGKSFDSVPSTGELQGFYNNSSVKLSIDGNGHVRDSAGTQRFIPNSTAKAIVDASATTLFTVPIAQSSAIGGIIHYQVYNTDGTDFQCLTGQVAYSSVNKAGTLTSTITNLTTVDAKAVSSGTLTLAWTMAEDTADVVSIKLQPTGSLTETTYNVTYNVFPLRGEVTVA